MYNYACLFLDHWKHWHGVQWDGSWLQASHPQSQKDGTGSVKKIVFGLLSSLLPLKDYYLMYHETIPTAQLVYRVALVMQEYTQSGGVSKIMFMSWHCYVIKSVIFMVDVKLLTLIFRWGHLECPSWSAAGTSRASRCFSRWDFFCKTL